MISLRGYRKLKEDLKIFFLGDLKFKGEIIHEASSSSLVINVSGYWEIVGVKVAWRSS